MIEKRKEFTEKYESMAKNVKLGQRRPKKNGREGM
jgi:hypothetical protein